MKYEGRILLFDNEDLETYDITISCDSIDSLIEHMHEAHLTPYENTDEIFDPDSGLENPSEDRILERILTEILEDSYSSTWIIALTLNGVDYVTVNHRIWN